MVKIKNQKRSNLKMNEDNKKNLSNDLISQQILPLKYLEIPFPTFLIHRDKFSRYVILNYNEEAKELFALPLERLINKEIRLFWPRESWDDFRKCIVGAIRKNQVTNLDSLKIEKEGRERTFGIRVWRIAENVACCVFFETIDKTYFTQSVLNERIKYEELFKHTPVMMLNVDQNGKIIDANLNWIMKTGFEREELIGTNVKDYFELEPDSVLAQKTFSGLLINNELINLPVQIRKKENGVIPSVITARSLFDINGNFIRCYLVAHDVSELKAIQEEYHNIEKLLKSLLENSASAILIYSSSKGITECNKKAEELLTEAKDRIIGKKIYDLELFKKNVINLDDLKSIFENPVSTYPEKLNLNFISNGQKKFFEISLTKIFIKEEPVAIISIVDKSIEIIKDQKIQETERRFQTIFEESNDALRLFDVSGKVIMMNKIANKYFGKLIDKKNFVQIKYRGFDYLQLFKSFVASDRLTESFEYRLKNDFGTQIIQESLNKIEFDSGEKIVYSVARDITKEKLSEEELKNREQNFKRLNDTKNKLLFILSHDLRAPVSSVVGIANAILEDSNLKKEEINNYISLIKSAATYQLDLINNLLDWSLLETGKFNYTLEPKNLEYAVYSSVNSVKGLIEQKKIDLDIKVHSCLVLIDLNLFSRILINLLSNAIKFSYPESKIWIRSNYIGRNRIEITIKDNGVGVDPEVLNKLFTFEEKVSRHGTAGERGTGLGLSLCKDMIKILNGSMKIKSPVKIVNKKPVGTMVSFDVPAIEPNIFVSNKVKLLVCKDTIKKHLSGYNIIRKNTDNYEKYFDRDYYIFIILNQNELSKSFIDCLLKRYRTTKNLIVVGNDPIENYNEIKSTKPEELVSFLKKEIHKLQFEFDQQKSIAREMKKIWF